MINKGRFSHTLKIAFSPWLVGPTCRIPGTSGRNLCTPSADMWIRAVPKPWDEEAGVKIYPIQMFEKNKDKQRERKKVEKGRSKRRKRSKGRGRRSKE